MTSTVTDPPSNMVVDVINFTIGEGLTQHEIGEGIVFCYHLILLRERGHNFDTFVADAGGINAWTNITFPKYPQGHAKQVLSPLFTFTSD